MTPSYSYINTKASLTLLWPDNTAFAVISLLYLDKATRIAHTKDSSSVKAMQIKAHM